MDDPFEPTQPTQLLEEASQETQDDMPLVAAHQKPVGKIVWKKDESILDRNVFLDTPLTIGRHRTCDIQVSSIVSSNTHCMISASFDKASDDYLVICEDLSSNGTFWNSKKIGKNKSVLLRHGDVIEIKRGYYFTYLHTVLKPTTSEAEHQIDSKYQITNKVLGKGTFAEIRQVLRKDTKEQIAVKIMEKRNFSLQGTAEGGANYIHEINLLRGIKHPNIVRVFDVAETPKHIYIFMPLLRGGDLFDYILDHERLKEPEAKYIVFQILLALKYLHDANIAHRDLKPENTLLVSKEPYSQIMLTDFGMAKATGQNDLMKTMCGTLQYIAPEMISAGVQPGQSLKIGYSKAVDCWSLGVMTYVMVSGMLPFTDDETNASTLFSQILSGHIDFNADCWKEITIDCQSFIMDLMRVDAKTRMSVADALKHPWIEKDMPRLAGLYAEATKTKSDGMSVASTPAQSPGRPKKHARPRDDDADVMGPPVSSKRARHQSSLMDHD